MLVALRLSLHVIFLQAVRVAVKHRSVFQNSIFYIAVLFKSSGDGSQKPQKESALPAFICVLTTYEVRSRCVRAFSKQIFCKMASFLSLSELLLQQSVYRRQAGLLTGREGERRAGRALVTAAALLA